MGSTNTTSGNFRKAMAAVERATGRWQIYLDMDGVLVDFVSGALRVHRRLDALAHWPAGEYALEKVLGLSTEEIWAPIHHHGEAFWANLEPYPWCGELLALCESLGEVTILSTPSADPYSAAGKLQWLAKYLPPRYAETAILAREKERLAHSRATLVDDNHRNTDRFSYHGGRIATFPQPWNRFYDHADPHNIPGSFPRWLKFACS